MMDNRLETWQNKLAERQFEEMRSTYKEMRGWHHDYRNHMQVLKVYLCNGKVPEINGRFLLMNKLKIGTYVKGNEILTELPKIIAAGFETVELYFTDYLENFDLKENAKNRRDNR